MAQTFRQLEPSRPSLETTKPRELQGLDGAGWLMIPNLVTPTGFQQKQKTLEKLPFPIVGGNAGGNIPSDLAELIELWPMLTKSVRKQCLELARCSMVENP